MFSEVFNLGRERKGFKEAFGFYLVHLITVIIVAATLSVVFSIGAENDAQAFDAGTRVGAQVAVLYCVGISLLILKHKALFKNTKYVLIALLAGVLSYFGGGILGLLVAAYFSTLPSHGAIMGNETPTTTPPQEQ